ncbi:MAG: hypothetical protein EBU62_14515, partial [Proteobacteria bacterium]|nr:hypothetical protein [Pseudomonadota bacterium]
MGARSQVAGLEEPNRDRLRPKRITHRRRSRRTASPRSWSGRITQGIVGTRALRTWTVRGADWRGLRSCRERPRGRVRSKP